MNENHAIQLEREILNIIIQMSGEYNLIGFEERATLFNIIKIINRLISINPEDAERQTTFSYK